MGEKKQKDLNDLIQVMLFRATVEHQRPHLHLTTKKDGQVFNPTILINFYSFYSLNTLTFDYFLQRFKFILKSFKRIVQ